jgi:hypothetical protein
MAKTYDARCYELAGWFCSDVPELANDAARRQLAREIQSVIEAEINWIKNHGVEESE